MDSWICIDCSKKFDIAPVFEPEEYEIKGKKIVIKAEKANCPCCGESLVNNAADSRNFEKVYRAYRKEENLLMPEEIKQIRLQYGITQVGFSKILGFRDKTIARYENGALQDTAPNNLILLMKDEKNFIKLWNARKNLLDPKDIQNVEKTLSSKYPTVRFDWRAAFNYYNTRYNTLDMPYEVKGVNLE